MTEPMQPNDLQDAKHGSFHVREYIYNYFLRHWYLYVITLALAVAGAYYYNWYVTPV